MRKGQRRSRFTAQTQRCTDMGEQLESQGSRMCRDHVGGGTHTPTHCKNNTRQTSSNVSQGVPYKEAGWNFAGAACLAGLYEHHEGRLLPQQLLQHQARGARLLVAACRGRCRQAEENCTRSGNPGRGRQLSGAGAPGQAAAAGAQGGARGAGCCGSMQQLQHASLGCAAWEQRHDTH